MCINCKNTGHLNVQLDCATCTGRICIAKIFFSLKMKEIHFLFSLNDTKVNDFDCRFFLVFIRFTGCWCIFRSIATGREIFQIIFVGMTEWQTLSLFSSWIHHSWINSLSLYPFIEVNIFLLSWSVRHDNSNCHCI